MIRGKIQRVQTVHSQEGRGFGEAQARLEASIGVRAVGRAAVKLSNVAKLVGRTSEEIYGLSLRNGRLFKDATTGNYNLLTKASVFTASAQGVVRLTFDPTFQRLISAGYYNARFVARQIECGRFIPQ